MRQEPEVTPIIRFDCVTKAFAEAGRVRTVLDGVSFEAAPGEFTVLLGRSGCGKSTVLNLISGIDAPCAGGVWMAGELLSALSERRRTLLRRKRIGFVFQSFNLVPTLTVRENLMLPLELNGMRSRIHRARALELLEEVGLADRRGAFPDRLSGGEQQRVAVARALVHDPLIVLADEPTGNLDEDTGRVVLELLDALTRRAGRNLCMVTHSADAARRADRVWDLRGGALREVRAVPRESVGV